MVGIPSFPFGHRPIFRCVLLLVSGRVTPSLLIQFATFLVVTSLWLFFQQVVEAWPCCERLKGCNFNRMLEGNSFTGMRWGSKKVGKTLYNPFPENLRWVPEALGGWKTKFCFAPSFGRFCLFFWECCSSPLCFFQLFWLKFQGLLPLLS